MKNNVSQVVAELVNLRRKTKMKNIKNIKNILIAILIIVVIALVGVIRSLNTENNMIKYAAANNCTWSWSGTLYGDDRDYICK